jgi:hypothetical protein
MTNATEQLELHQLAALARRRAADARSLAADRRRLAGGALAARQISYAQGLLDSACWLDAAAELEDRRAAQLDSRRAALLAQARAFDARVAGGAR